MKIFRSNIVRTKLRSLLRSSRIQIAIASGTSILIIAICSKWVLDEPMHPFLLTVPPLIEVTYEGLLKKHKNSYILKTWYWVCGILISTILIIIIHIII